MEKTFRTSQRLVRNAVQGAPLAAVAGAFIGCAGDPANERPRGDAALAHLHVEPMLYTEPDTPTRLLRDGDDVELWPAPQGGHVVLVGARVAGLDSRVVELAARLRRPGTREIVAEEKRTVTLEPVAGDPSLLESERRTRTQVAHVATCPDYESVNVVDEMHELEVLVREMAAPFATGTASTNVVPRCLQTDTAANAQCRCECSADYRLGKCSFQ
jgi:hypothetical protein